MPRLISSNKRTGANIETLALCSALTRYGCEERGSAKGICIYQCSGKYVTISDHPIACNVARPGRLLSVGLAFTVMESEGPFITLCVDSITLRARGRVIRIERILLNGVRDDGSIALGVTVKVPHLHTGARISLISAPEKVTIVFTSAENETWERTNLSGEDIVSSLLRDENARKALEDAAHSLAEILKSIPWRQVLATYLLY